MQEWVDRLGRLSVVNTIVGVRRLETTESVVEKGIGAAVAAAHHVQLVVGEVAVAAHALDAQLWEVVLHAEVVEELGGFGL
jgi:hypothetical protein